MQSMISLGRNAVCVDLPLFNSTISRENLVARAIPRRRRSDGVASRRAAVLPCTRWPAP
jgi:hypothetical protein